MTEKHFSVAPLLTDREQEVLRLARRGLSLDRIAKSLDLSSAAARSHVDAITRKLGASTLEEAVAWKGRQSVSGSRRVLDEIFRFRLPLATIVVTLLIGSAAWLHAWNTQIHHGGTPGDIPTIRVSWREIGAPPSSGIEAAHPYLAGLAPGVLEDVWHAYVVVGNTAPRPILDAPHELEPNWVAAGRVISFSFLSAPQRGLADLGFTTVDIDRSSIVASRFPIKGGAAYGSGSDYQVAFVNPPEGAVAAQIYILDRAGQSKRLELPKGLLSRNIFSLQGSPNGHWLSFAVSLPSATNGDFVVVSPSSLTGFAVGHLNLLPSWSPDGRRLAGIEDDVLRVIDLEKQRVVETHFQQILSGRPNWSADGRFVALAGAIVDASTGNFVGTPRGGQVATIVSADGSWAAMTSDGTACGARAQEPGFAATPRKTVVTNLATGEEKVVVDCSQGDSKAFRWMDASHLVILRTACIGLCGTSDYRFFLISASDGRETPLNDDGEKQVGFAISPDGSRILIGGKALREYDADGNMLLTIPTAPGTTVGSIGWSPDGSAFVYVVGPLLIDLTPRGPSPVP